MLRTIYFVFDLSFAFLLFGCGGGGGQIATFTASNTGAEPAGGQFRPVVLASSAAIRLPGPSAESSPQTAQELIELRQIQAQGGRGSDALVSARAQLTTTQNPDTVAFWNAGACVRWNEIAREIVARTRTAPPLASRVYALLSVAQYDACVAAWNNKYSFNRRAPSFVDPTLHALVSIPPDPGYPSEHAAIAAASASVLSFLYPQEAASLQNKATQHQESRLFALVNYRSDITDGADLGRQVADLVIARARNDRADQAANPVTIPGGPGFWNGTNPLLPGWGQVQPWLMTASNQFRPGPPPAFGSPEFQSALEEVRRISDNRTAEQSRIANFWADGLGTVTPPGHWNQIASDLLSARRFNEIRCARTLALMNMAVMDAGICCWDAKYTYWLIRPSQQDPAITTPVGLPNFPSYTSGHSSFSGAASTVLAYIFPDQASSLSAMADEAAVSRLYGGIHYRFDNDQGLVDGRGIAQLAIERGRTDGSP